MALKAGSSSVSSTEKTTFTLARSFACAHDTLGDGGDSCTACGCAWLFADASVRGAVAMLESRAAPPPPFRLEAAVKPPDISHELLSVMNILEACAVFEVCSVAAITIGVTSGA